MRVALGYAVVVACVGCATPRLDDPPLAMQIVATGLRQDEREELRDAVCSIDGVSQCELVGSPTPPAAAPGAPAAAAPPKGRGKGAKAAPKKSAEPEPPPSSPEATITFSYRGSLGNLRWRIAQLPHPGLEPQKADVRLAYRGFDNEAPHIEIVEPKDKAVTTEKNVKVVAKVPDVDTAEVRIGGNPAARAGALYSATIEGLKEGDNPIAIKATDEAGNARDATVTVIVDTTPPDLTVEVQVLAYDKAVVRGKVSSDATKVTVDGRDVPRDLFGAFEKDVAVDPDKSMVEVVAVDEHGNAKKIRRSVKIASPMSDATAK